MQASAIQGTPFGPAQEFVGSPYKEIGIGGLFNVHSAETSRIAVLPNGDDSYDDILAVNKWSKLSSLQELF